MISGEFNKEKIYKIIDSVLEEKSETLAYLNQGSIDVFKFLQSEFYKGDVTKNHLFLFVYRSFYRLDNAGLTPEFKKKYFELMESSRGKQLYDIEIILCELEKFPRIKEKKKGEEKGSFQFSFATKLMNTIDKNFPIYDSQVSKVIIGTDHRPTGDFKKKLSVYKNRHEIIKKAYAHILKNDSFSSIFNEFDKSFPGNELHEVKKLDFIFWSNGKLKAQKEQLNRK